MTLLAAKNRGFTLLELLVALSIFGLVAAMAYGGLNTVLNGIEATDRHNRRLAELQTAMHLLVTDLEQAVPRPVRGEYGDPRPPLLAREDLDRPLVLTRTGHRNPLGRRRSQLQRVAYRIDDEHRLVRRVWPVLDRAADSRPRETPILDHVSELELRFPDGERWRPFWPLLDERGQASHRLPRAVELRIRLDDWGLIRRLVTLTASGPPTL